MKYETKEELVQALRDANEAYRTGCPIMSDSEFDQLQTQLRMLDPVHPLLSFVNDCDEGFGQECKLTIAMGSQDKAMSLEELGSFYRRIGTQERLSVSEKLDGASLELTYENGNFVRAITRGDGEMGTDISQIAKVVPSIPLKLKGVTWKKAIVRGEMILKKTSLEALNPRLMHEGRKPYESVRNGTVGLMKTLKNLPYAQYLSFKAFDLMVCEE